MRQNRGSFTEKKHQNCKRKMEIIKECGVCGKAFVASKMSVKYCCRGCERVAFRRREAEKKKKGEGKCRISSKRREK